MTSLQPEHVVCVNLYKAMKRSCVGPGSSVGIATNYGLDGPGIESRWGRDFPPVQTGPEAHPAYCKMGTGSFPGVKCSRGVLLATHPLLVPRSWKSKPLPTLWVTPGPVTGSLYLSFFTCIVTHYFRALNQMSPSHHGRRCPRG